MKKIAVIVFLWLAFAGCGGGGGSSSGAAPGGGAPDANAETPPAAKPVGFFRGTITITRDDTGTTKVPQTLDSMNLIGSVNETIFFTNAFLSGFSEGFKDLLLIAKVSEVSAGQISFSGKGANGTRTVTISGTGTVANGILSGEMKLVTDAGVTIAFNLGGTSSALRQKSEEADAVAGLSFKIGNAMGE